MIYTVTWKPEAERRLAELWLAASDRQLLADAANNIERTLRQLGKRAGDLLSEPYRVITAPPLRAVFTAQAEDHVVNVIAVWRHESSD